MTAQFRLTTPAMRDLESIADYMATQASLSQAERFLAQAEQKFVKLARFPNLGRARDEILPGMRSLPLDNYLILYVSTAAGVDILRVVSGYRDLTALFTDSEE